MSPIVPSLLKFVGAAILLVNFVIAAAAAVLVWKQRRSSNEETGDATTPLRRGEWSTHRSSLLLKQQQRRPRRHAVVNTDHWPLTARKTRDLRHRQTEETVVTCGGDLPFAEATQTTVDGSVFMRSAFYEACVSQIPVEWGNMLHQLVNIEVAFRQYYAFYGIVNDPASSQPNQHQAELGYQIYGKGEGQIGLDATLRDLFAQVAANGATGATFWQVHETVNQLRDANVQLPQYNDNSFVRDYFVRVFPERSILGDELVKSFKIYFDKDAELQLEVVFADVGDGAQTTLQVDTMLGLSVHDFFVGLSNSPALVGLDYQSRGTRLNALLEHVENAARLETGGSLLTLPANGAPSNILPDKFTVVYESGDEESYYTTVEHEYFRPRELYQLFVHNTSGAESILNAPGHAYVSYERGIRGGGTELVSGPRRPYSTYDETQQHLKKYLLLPGDGPRTIQGTEYDFDEVLYYDTNIRSSTTGGVHQVPAAAYKVLSDHAVLKLQDFSFDAPFARKIWNRVASQAKGVDKLIIDISNSHGSSMSAAESLAASLFPPSGAYDESYQWFQNQWDTKVTQAMRVFNISVGPVLDLFIEANVDHVLRDEEIVERGIADILKCDEVKAWLQGLHPTDLGSLKSLSVSLLDLCNQGCPAAPAPHCSYEAKRRCGHLRGLRDALGRFASNPTPPQLLAILETVAQLIRTEFNPYTVVPGRKLQDQHKRKVDMALRKVLHGGIETNLTNHFTLFPRCDYVEAVVNALGAGHSFTQYVIVSNGLATSAASVFANKVELLVKNAAKTGVKVPVEFVTYGGLPDGNTSISGAPTTTQDTHLEYALITDGLLNILEKLLPAVEGETNTLATAVNTARLAFEQVLPVPPYFGTTPFSIPVLTYYSPFMQLPLQYVRNKHYHHLTPHYDQLDKLYDKLTEYFSDGGEDDSAGGEGDVPARRWR